MSALAEARAGGRRLREKFNIFTRRQIEDGWRLCKHCGKPLHPNVFRHASKRCPGYSGLWAMDVYVVFGENVREFGGRAALFTVTPPGIEYLPWDKDHCRHLGEHKHNGELGCGVDPKMAAMSAAGAAALYGCAAGGEAAGRSRGCTSARLARREGVEAAVVVGASEARRSPCARAASVGDASRAAVVAGVYRRLGRDWGSGFWFGNMDALPQADAAEKLARYVAGYALGGGGGRALEEAVRSLDWMPARTFHVNRKLTQRTGATMRAARFNRRVNACFSGKCHWPVRERIEWERAVHFRFRSVIRAHGEAACEWLIELELARIPPEAQVP